jgi:predicted dehydrogenase
MSKEKIKFGIIGLGLMGREFASAAARWCHLPDFKVKPEITAICDLNEGSFSWYTDNFPSIKQATANYHELLANPEIEAVYCAVPHNLHEKFYCDIINSGKHLMGEKPFGIDQEANNKIMKCMKNNPDVFVRCSSEFPFIPAAQYVGKMVMDNAFGKIIEVNSGFLHSSDLDPNKAINWKRRKASNGEYGCMGDLGMHACNMPFRAGWNILNVRAILSDLMPERPDGKGGTAACDTWDNASMFCEAQTENGSSFPLTIKTQRIAPGQKDTWYIEILGTEKSVRFSTKNPKKLEIMDYAGTGSQAWQVVDMGHETAFKSITGGIFEFGFSDAILQMWAAYIYELTTGKAKHEFAACVTPEEAILSHRLFTAALKSHKNRTTELV